MVRYLDNDYFAPPCRSDRPSPCGPVGHEAGVLIRYGGVEKAQQRFLVVAMQFLQALHR